MENGRKYNVIHFSVTTNIIPFHHFFKKLFSCVEIASCSIILNRQELTANSIQIKEITVCIFSQGERRREIEIVYFPTQFQPAERKKQI